MQRVREDITVVTVDVDLQQLFFEGPAVSADSECAAGCPVTLSHFGWHVAASCDYATSRSVANALSEG